jgi:hypothetical protein
MMGFAAALAALALLKLCGCGGAEFTTIGALRVDAGDDQEHVELVDDAGATLINPDHVDAGDAEDPHVVMTTDAGAGVDASPVETPGGDAALEAAAPRPDAGGPHLCDVNACPLCPMAKGYACCSLLGACGCENPSQGGSCQ